MKTEKARKKRGKNRRKVLLEEVLGVYCIKEAHYSNCTYYAGKTIDSYNNKETALEFIKALNLRLVN